MPAEDDKPTPEVTPKEDEKKEPPAEPDKKEQPPAAAKTDEDSLKSKLAETEAQLKKLQKEKSEKEEAERVSKLSAEQKAAEYEAEIKKMKRENLIQNVRLSHGFTDKVFNAVVASGDTEEEIKKAFEDHKAALDEYIKAAGVKEAPGKGTEGGKRPDGKTPVGDNVPYLIRRGLVQEKKVV